MKNNGMQENVRNVLRLYNVLEVCHAHKFYSLQSYLSFTGCPHMTCQSCSCEFCYLCGRRYVQIPFIGQHSNKFRFVFLFI